MTAIAMSDTIGVIEFTAASDRLLFAYFPCLFIKSKKQHLVFLPFLLQPLQSSFKYQAGSCSSTKLAFSSASVYTRSRSHTFL